MNIEHTKKLLTDFPNLYKQYKLPMTQTAMCWGFEVGDGWYNLIYELSEKIIKLDPECEAVQVKEKYGTLRFYIDAKKNYEDLFDLISEYEDKSGETCEICGEIAKQRGQGWITTRCDNCYQKEEEERYK